MKKGDIVINALGWQGEVIKKSKSKRFGVQVLVEYASRREWENILSLYVAAITSEVQSYE